MGVMRKHLSLVVLIAICVAGVVALLGWTKNNATGIQNTQSGDSSTLEQRLNACESIPSGSLLEVRETSRVFINLPEDVYPFQNRKFEFDGAQAGMISNGEGLGPRNGSELVFAANNCATHYYEFNGYGAVDLLVKSAKPEFPDYNLHFNVTN